MAEEQIRAAMRVRYHALSRQLDQAEPELDAAEAGRGEWPVLKHQIKRKSLPRLRALSKKIRQTLMPNLGRRLKLARKRVARFEGITWRSGPALWLRVRILMFVLGILCVYLVLIGLVGFFVYLGIQMAAGVSL